MRNESIPGHLTKEAAAWVRRLRRDYRFEAHAVPTLVIAAELWDRKEAARLRLQDEGLTVTNRHGELRPHPLVSVQRDAAVGYMRAVRELALPADEAPESRPPMLRNRYQGRA